MGASDRIKLVILCWVIDAIVGLLLFLPWTLASIVALSRNRAFYETVVHYPLVSTSISALPGGSVGMFPNYIIVEIVLILLMALTTLIARSQWKIFKIEQKERIREKVRRNSR